MFSAGVGTPLPSSRAGGTRATIEAGVAAVRALLLERERIVNHLGDLGYLGNDVALGFGLAQFMRLGWLEQSERRYRITDREQLSRRAR